MKSHDLADDPAERELERRAREKAEEDDLRQKMDAFSTQEKVHPGTMPDRRKDLQEQRDSHAFAEGRLEREMDRNAVEQAEKDDLRRRMDALAAQHKPQPGTILDTHDELSEKEANSFVGNLREESEAHARGRDNSLFDRKVTRDRMDETWRESKDWDHAHQTMARKEVAKDYEAKCAAYYDVPPADRDKDFVFLDGMDKDTKGAWSRIDHKYTLNTKLLDEDSAGNAANTIEHECSHRADFEKGYAPVHYFSETPEPPQPLDRNGARDGVMLSRPGENRASYEARYSRYAGDYEAYISKWDNIDEKDIVTHYVDPPDAPPLAPDPDVSDATCRDQYNGLYARYDSGFDKYERSDGERQARAHEWRWWKEEEGPRV